MRQIVRLDFAEAGVAERIFDEAFQHPRRKYVIQPVDAEVARRWLCEHANIVNFVWCGGAKSLRERLAEGGALHPGQLIHLDTLYYRNRCGWMDVSEGADYTCDAPPGDDTDTDSANGKRRCFAWNCPIAYEAGREDIRRKAPELFKSDFKPYPDQKPDDDMVLHSRPRYAYVPNVTVLGCDGWEDYA